MLDRLLIRPARVKLESEQALLASGAQVFEGLPHIEHTTPRPAGEIGERALVLNALIQLAFKAPPLVIRDWLKEHDLSHALAGSERFVMEAPEMPLSDQILANLSWSIEALWALMWVCDRHSRLRLDEPAGRDLAAMLPNLQVNESATGFRRVLRRRPYRELYAMRDLIYRAHWYARDGNLRGYPTPPVRLDVIMERRKALEWATDRTQDWDNTDQST